MAIKIGVLLKTESVIIPSILCFFSQSARNLSRSAVPMSESLSLPHAFHFSLHLKEAPQISTRLHLFELLRVKIEFLLLKAHDMYPFLHVYHSPDNRDYVI